MDEAKFEKLFERVERKYAKKIVAKLKEIGAAFRSEGHVASEPYEMEDGYDIIVDVSPPDIVEKVTRRLADKEDEEVDIMMRVADSREYDGSRDGINFMLDIVAAPSGRIIGGLTPYNYTAEVWVPLDDSKAIEERWQIMKNVDPDEIVNLVEEAMFERD